MRAADPAPASKIGSDINWAEWNHREEVCNHFLASFAEVTKAFNYLSGEPRIISQFARLDPKDGTGYLNIDVTPAIPAFLRNDGHKKFDWPKSKAFGFEGDPDVPHYIDMARSREELGKIIGDKNVAELQAFGLGMTDFVEKNLPLEEQGRMHAQNLELVLDLAELRVGVGTGSSVHLDWQPREGMVMIVPIYGNRTAVFDKSKEKVPDFKVESGQLVASLITGYERWANYHAFNCSAGVCGPGTFMPRQDGVLNGVVVPDGAKTYIRSRGQDVPTDMFPNAPGMLPTIHRAGEGPRMVLVLNFAYRKRGAAAQQNAVLVPGRDYPEGVVLKKPNEPLKGIDVNYESLGPFYGADSPQVLELTGDGTDGP